VVIAFERPDSGPRLGLLHRGGTVVDGWAGILLVGWYFVRISKIGDEWLVDSGDWGPYSSLVSLDLVLEIFRIQLDWRVPRP
jgi:hypothetical protein